MPYCVTGNEPEPGVMKIQEEFSRGVARLALSLRHLVAFWTTGWKDSTLKGRPLQGRAEGSRGWDICAKYIWRPENNPGYLTSGTFHLIWDPSFPQRFGIGWSSYAAWPASPGIHLPSSLMVEVQAHATTQLLIGCWELDPGLNEWQEALCWLRPLSSSN